jgi:two-component system copper resistance phosphate regulon response regulator CusR
MKILIIEDEIKTAHAIHNGLQAEGYEAKIASTGPEGLERLQAETFDVVVLDWMLPGADGIEILRELRGTGTKPPVLLLTAKDAVEDRVKGLDSGADDYLVKPFAFAELLARLRALTRRSGNEESLRLQAADLFIDLKTRQVSRDGNEIALTPREYDLLVYLMRHAGETVTRNMIARDVWRETNRSTPLDNVIDVHLARLRRKVDEGRAKRLIHTIRGVGFLCGEKPGPESR